MVKSTDYIIIGAGPAGVCAANILSKSGKNFANYNNLFTTF